MMHSKVLTALLCCLFVLSCSAVPTCPKECTCSKYLKRVSCEHRELYEIPSGIPEVATELYLGYNRLTVINSGAFSTLHNLTYLSLTNNLITNLSNHSFSGLQKLKNLTLRKNRLRTISRDAFHDLGSLQRLYLTDNFLTAVPDFSFVPNLTYLTLDTNNLESANLCSGSSNLTRLSTIILSNNGNLSRISNEDFHCVNRLSVRFVDVSRCSLTKFEDDFFRFRHLQSLKLSYNNISYDMLMRIFDSISLSDLTSLDLSGVLQLSDIIPPELFKNLSRVKLNHLSLSHTTNVGHITYGTFQYLRSMEILDLSSSDFMLITDTSFSLMPNLSRISLNNNQHLFTVPKFNTNSLQRLDLNDNLQIDKLLNGIFSGLSNLSILMLQGCNIRTVETHAFLGLQRLQKLDLSRNKIAGLPRLSAMSNLLYLDISSNKLAAVSTEHSLFGELTKLQWLDFSQNDCGNLSTRIFHPLVSLQTLNLAGNRLGRVVEADAEGQLFRGLSKLRTLRLDDNEMRSLQYRAFDSLSSLRMLNLSNNYLASWAAGMFNASDELDTIDFSSNKIAIVTEQELMTMPKNTSLNFTDNPFACYCDLIWFRRWIQAHNSSKKLSHLQLYTCSSPDAMAKKPLLDFNPDDIEARCHILPLMRILVAACSAVVAVMLFIVGVVYRYRWRLRLRLFYAMRRFRKRRPAGYTELDGGFDFDIYVSYGPSLSDREWVTTELMPRFIRRNRNENADGHQFEHDGQHVAGDNRGLGSPDRLPEDNNGLAAPDRLPGDNDGLAAPDRLPGDNDGLAAPEPILGEHRVFIEEEGVQFGLLEFDVLAESIYKSKKVMIVVSDEYLYDYRRQFELEWAIKSRYEKELHLDDSIIVVCLEPQADIKVPPVLLQICRKQELEWTQQDKAGQELFWLKLAEVIKYKCDDDDLLEV